MAKDRRVTFLIGANIRNFQKNLGKAQSQFRKAGYKMERMGKRMTQSISLPLAAAGGMAVKAAGDFESSFADIRKTVDTTEQQFGKISEGMREMAKSVPTSVNELNRIGGVAGQLGVEAENIVQFTETIAMLGDATDIAGEQAALSLSRFMNVMGTAQSDIDRLGATIVGLGNNFAAMESEIVGIATSMAPLGNSIGLTEQQVLAFSTTIASSGGKIEAASTAFQKTANTMKQAVLEGNGDLEVFAETAGMSASEFQRAFQEDAAGALQAFLGGLRRVQQEGGSTATVLEQVGLADQRLVREFGKVLGNLDELDVALGQANTEWERNTALTEEAQKRYGTFNSRMSILYNQLYDLGIVIGNALIPVVNKLITKAESLIEYFSGLNDSTIQMGVVMGALAAAVGPVVWVLGQLVTSTAAVMGALSALMGLMMTMAKGVISFALVGSFTKFAAAMRLARMKGVVPMTKSIGTAMKAFALMALKVAAVIGAVGGVVLVAKSIYDAWDTVGPFFAQLWDNIIGTFAAGVQQVARVMAKMPGMEIQGQAIIAQMEAIKMKAEESIKDRGIISFKDTYTAVWEEMKGNTAASVDYIKGLYSDMTGFIGGLMPGFSTEAQAAAGSMSGGSGQPNPISSKPLPDPLKNTDVGKLQKASGAYDSIAEAMGRTTEKAKVMGQALQTSVTSAITGFAETLGNAFTGDAGAEGFFNTILMVAVDFANKFGKLLVAAGTAALAFESLLANPIAAIVAGTALIAATTAVKNLLKQGPDGQGSPSEGGPQIPGMAQGGIVPSGFPNDTYPAMLSSGETVIPSPKPLPNMGGGQVIENVLVLDGKEIYRNQRRIQQKYDS